MKTVYLTDLDGTLFGPDAALSDITKDALRRLHSAGVCVGISTARTAATVSRIFEGVPLGAPAALMNGVCIFDTEKGRYLQSEAIPDQSKDPLLSAICGSCAFVYTIDETGLSTFYENDDSPHARSFRIEREIKYGKVFTRVDSLLSLTERRCVYVSVAGREEEVAPLRRKLIALPGLNLHYYRDIYDTDFFYLEACAAGVSKSAAARRIRDLTGAEKLVGFGDNLNDLSLFDECDKCFAVSNAADAVKDRADFVIGSNREDAVVKTILRLEGLEESN